METDAHPLAYLLHLNGWTATNYLARLSVVHQRLGYGKLDVHQRKRVSRWIREGITPEMNVQLAMAVLHGIATHEIAARPWPEWLKPACVREQDLLDAEWTAQTTLDLLDRVAAPGGPMERRGFLVVTGTAIGSVLAGAATAQPAAARTPGRRISRKVPALFEQSLAVLRRQDDQLGAGQVHASARAQLRLITGTLRGAAYSEDTGRRLYAAAAEAARICAWTAYDSGYHGLAEEYYVAALRAAGSSGDPVVTANTKNFWAIMRYSNGDPKGAADLVTDALAQTGRIGSPRLEAMLHARLARSHARAGDQRAAARAQTAAFEAYDRARDRSPEEEPDCVYWVNLGELHSWAATSAMDLQAPAQALTHFAAIPAAHRDEGYDSQAYPRAVALRLARTAEAHAALGDLDGAVHSAHQAVTHMGSLTSTRGNSALNNLRAKMADHESVPAVREFLESTA
ncbi:transcriptional regulator [Streptomyces sp. NPDC059743]|uniref:transcriptional regulator n=1 Tax=Streptomyces sp. NPDC059743 TaxID=3346928 RepID=UPI003664CB2E